MDRTISGSDELHLYCPAQLPLAAARGQRQLEAALADRGRRATLHSTPAGLDAFVAHGSMDVGSIAADLPSAGAGPESFRIDTGSQDGRRWAAVRGSDPNGLAYGLDELAAQIQLRADADPLAAVQSCSRSPLLELRSVNVFVVNPILEQSWLYDRGHWESYFELLARSRLNGLTLTLGNHSPLFAPVFPFMLEVPGFEHVRPVPGLPTGREANLEMLRMVSGLARQWGVRFTLALWQQHAYRLGEPLAQGLPYQDLFAYCPRALAALLDACPDISGLQFRINHESGILPEDQLRFYGAIFEAIRDAGRPIRVDLRAKGLKAETLAAAQDILGEVTVSTKYWHEHMGLPYHGTAIIPQDMKNYRRYGYWDLLPKGRRYRMLYQLWSHGTQRVLSWADPAHAARFAQSCRLGDGEGFEIAAPLSHRGFGDSLSPAWRVFADPAAEHYAWEFQRYWPFFTAFGLAGYGGGEGLEAYRAQWLNLGRDNGPRMGRALAAASECLPLVTAFHCKSSSVFGYWPEMDIGGTTDVYINVSTGDPGRISSIAEYVREVVEQNPTGRLNPPQVAARLRAMAGQVDRELAAIAPSAAGENVAKELHALATDCRMLAALARYHAARIESGLQYAFFLAGGPPKAMHKCVADMEEALRHWRQLAELGAQYHDGLSFGVFSVPHVGHWKDDLPLLTHDLDRLRAIEQLWPRATARPQEVLALAVEQPWYELKTEWAFEGGRTLRRMGERIVAGTPSGPAYEGTAARAILQEPTAVAQDVLQRLGSDGAAAAAAGYERFEACRSAPPPTIEHQRIDRCRAGQDLPIAATVRSEAALQAVRLHYRALNQALPWQVVPMTSPEGLHFAATIPGSSIGPDWDLAYAIEAIDHAGGGAFHPDLFVGEPSCIVEVCG